MTLASPLKTVIGNRHSIIKLRAGLGGTIKLVRSNGADLFISAAVTYSGETASDPDVDLCAKGEQPDGIIIGPAYDAIDLDKDSDDTFADNTWLYMYSPLPGEEIYMTTKTNSAIDYGARVQVDGGFLIAFTYGDATEETDLLQSVVGKTLTAISATASTEKIALIKWGTN